MTSSSPGQAGAEAELPEGAGGASHAEDSADSGGAPAARDPEIEALRASQARLAGILDIADDAIITANQQQQITQFNQGAEKIFGYAAHEVVGQPLDMLLPARFSAAHHRHVNTFARSPDTARRMGERQDIYGRRKDGSEFPAEASISRLDLAGETTYTVILRDITTRKRFEQRLQEQNIELAQAIRAKDRFLANMSHELRTPLNAIIGFTGTLLMRLPGQLNADQERQLKTVQSSARHLLALINDLLDLTKIESGKVELSREPVICQEVVSEVVDSLRPLAERKGLRLTADGPADQIVLQADRRALSQILINLLSNAIKFTQAGEVAVLLRRTTNDNHPIGSTLAIDPSPFVTFAVRDTGRGIRPADQMRLFEAFAQGQEPPAADRGTGLGLHLSQRLAGLLGGRIEVESDYGQGSTFTLVIPE
ncbi:MAG: PAS domain S-box protein [Kouleothrix sp.]|nr:PAS domain S-box protein [Kouleothrix sp.]